MGLVGRRYEIAEVRRLLDAASAGRGGLLIVTGAPGSGKTALVDVAVEEARQRGLEVFRAAPAPGHAGRLLWAQLLGDLGAGDDVVRAPVGAVDPLTWDLGAHALVAGSRRLVVVDDLDDAGPDAIDFLALAAGRVGGGGTALLVVATSSLGFGDELRLGGLAEPDLAEALADEFGDLGPDLVHALWTASRGIPGVARSLAARLDRHAEVDPVVRLALEVPSQAAFLEVDAPLVGLLELASERTSTAAGRARVRARLAYELLGDATAGDRRRELADEALVLARRSGDPGVLAAVLDARLHALWDPDAVFDRLAAASEIVDLAKRSGDVTQERRGLFWRFVALMELGRVGEAEWALAAFEREARLAGDGEGLVTVTARHAMLAIFRGKYPEALSLIDDLAVAGQRAQLPDADRLVGTLRGAMLVELGPPEAVDAALAVLAETARRLPGHLFEAMAAGVLATFGRGAEAAIELERILPRALANPGPRWLGSIAVLAYVAARAGDGRAAAQLYDALLPYRGRLAVLGGANTTIGPVSHFLGLLAARLGRLDDAAAWFEEAIVFEEQVGAVPFLARSLAGLAAALDERDRPGDREAAVAHRTRARTIAESLGMTVLLADLEPASSAWSLRRDGDDWLLDTGAEHIRLRDSRGLHYLRALLAAPGRDVAALDLVAGGAGLAAGGGDAVLDAPARRAYLRRLDELTAELDAADWAGDARRAEAAEAERQALLGQLRQATGLGGRPRTHEPEAERARVNVTRTIRATLDRIAAAAPIAGAHLQASVRTGRACRYEPAPGGPVEWRL